MVLAKTWKGNAFCVEVFANRNVSEQRRIVNSHSKHIVDPHNIMTNQVDFLYSMPVWINSWGSFRILHSTVKSTSQACMVNYNCNWGLDRERFQLDRNINKEAIGRNTQQQMSLFLHLFRD